MNTMWFEKYAAFHICGIFMHCRALHYQHNDIIDTYVCDENCQVMLCEHDDKIFNYLVEEMQRQ